MTLRCLTEAPEVFQAGRRDRPRHRLGRLRHLLHRALHGHAREQPRRATATRRSCTRVDRLKGDLLIIHGMLDENVHFRHTARLVSALIAAGKPFRDAPAARGAALLAQGGRPEVRGRATGDVLRDGARQLTAMNRRTPRRRVASTPGMRKRVARRRRPPRRPRPEPPSVTAEPDVTDPVVRNCPPRGDHHRPGLAGRHALLLLLFVAVRLRIRRSTR